jgi:3-hydroxyacyl-CoA dehydrogenase/enoyl-CoA hydratase/3-hydroxybutyryl-CoA epimerase/3-hydroxyacyl-CoA dehydrogenase/enoyl-CoA hydratase/3-hydroxybutyryl-CoA epimerase/enoyl-CoA isomerase
MPDKSANILNTSVLQELDQHLDTLEQHSDCQGLILRSGKPGTFIAGADLREFAASLQAPQEEIQAMCRRGQTLFGRLAKCPFVTIAAIDGICVGGGAEMAVWCDRRIMTSNERTEIGFPEVKLGLFPGWGGTVRAPRIVGLSNAVEMITGGDSISAKQAAAMGLADELTDADRLLPAAVNLALREHESGDYMLDRMRWNGPIDMSETELGFLGATASAMIRSQTKGQYPAPEAALEVMLGSAGLEADAACQQEAEGMSKLFGSPVNAALLNVFFLTDRNKKDQGVEGDHEANRLQQIGVAGAGIMGAGIAAATLRRDYPVIITDASRSALARGAQHLLSEAAYDREAKGASSQRMSELASKLNIAYVDEEFQSCDLLIEAIIENAEAKKKFFARMEHQLKPEAVLASNTSTIPITTLAEGLQHPERFCGIHFFNPVRKMKLVEIIRGEQTSDETIVTAVKYAKSIKKMPIVVGDGPGFLVNRLLFPLLNESLQLITEGVAMPDIEKAAKKFGMPMGPLELYDMVGLDTAVYAGRVVWEAFPDRVAPSPILPMLVKSGRLGQKSGSGFYSYKNRKGRAEADPQVEKMLSAYRKQESSELTIDQISDRLFLPMLLEATRALESGIARSVHDIDIGMIFGLGFPPFKGGLMFWADTLGAEEVLRRLEPWKELGPRYQPTELLKEMATKSGKFYAEEIRN